MNHRDHHNKHTALMLLACAFAFVYLLMRQFQGQDLVNKWQTIHTHTTASTTNSTADLPARLEPTPSDIGSAHSGQIATPSAHPSEIVATETISFTSLNAVPQSFIRLGLASTAGIMMDKKRVIVTTNINTIKRKGDSKTLTSDEIKKIGLNVDSLTFYNDPSWANILVLMEVVHNQQSVLIQAPYSIRRDDKAYLNTLITQLTQK